MSRQRIAKINEEIKKELSIIIRGLKDPRISEMTSVVSVNTSNDLRQAKVYVSVYGNSDVQKNCIEGLKSAANFIRREVGKALKIRYIPEFIFELDHSIEHGVHISELLKTMPELKGDENDS